MTACLSILPPRKRQALPDPQIHLGSVSSYALFFLLRRRSIKKKTSEIHLQKSSDKKEKFIFLYHSYIPQANQKIYFLAQLFQLLFLPPSQYQIHDF